MGFLIHIHRAKDGIIQVPFSAPGIYQLISISSECPYLQPESGQLCASPYVDNSCLYSGDLCCCDRCSDYFTFSCVLNSTTGDHHWQSSLCPAEGCGDQGETFSFLDLLNIILKLYSNFPQASCRHPTILAAIQTTWSKHKRYK